MPETWEKETDFGDDESEGENFENEDEYEDSRELATAEDEDDGFEDDW